MVECKGISKAYGDHLLFEDLTFTLPRGGIVGIIGPNGAGKTTLFKMITGQEKPDGGNIKIGETVDIAYVDQSRDALDPNKTVWQEISGGQEVLSIAGRDVNSRAYVSKFNFNGADQQKKVGVLSGGERNRVHLAKLLKRGGNLLLLDEPTNDLDVDTLRHPRRRCCPSPAAPSSSATTAGSSTGSPPTSSPSRATPRCPGSRATSPTTRPTRRSASATTPSSRTGSATGS
nr:ATP-binding cassette domain-containing protein [Nannocystis radixulma]